MARVSVGWMLQPMEVEAQHAPSFTKPEFAPEAAQQHTCACAFRPPPTSVVSVAQSLMSAINLAIPLFRSAGYQYFYFRLLLFVRPGP